MDERLRFVARLLDGEKMARLCAEFGISRKTGYKIYRALKEVGVQGSATGAGGRTDTPTSCRWSIEKSIVRLKREYPSWGAPRSASGCGNAGPRSGVPPSAPSMRCSIATGW